MKFNLTAFSTGSSLFRWSCFICILIFAGCNNFPSKKNPYAATYRNFTGSVQTQDISAIRSFKELKEGVWDKNWSLVHSYTKTQENSIGHLGFFGIKKVETQIDTICILYWKLVTDSCTIIRREQYSPDQTNDRIDFLRCRNDSVYATGIIHLYEKKKKHILLEEATYFDSGIDCISCKGDTLTDCSIFTERVPSGYTSTILIDNQNICSFSSSGEIQSEIFSPPMKNDIYFSFSGDSLIRQKGESTPGIHVSINTH